jgi:beta-lactamase superfamily II metal-dependent hydrolase
MGSAPPLRQSKLAQAAPLTPSASDLVVYILNVGDGDAIVLQFPQLPEDGGSRAFAVVDSNDGDKSLDLLSKLGATALRFVCATHPHIDHIRGIPKILQRHRGQVEELWDSGFRYTSKTYNRIMKKVESQGIQFIRPTSGFETFIKGVRVTVLSPSIGLRNLYDTYGVDANNASIVLRIEYPHHPPSDEYPTELPSAPAASEPRTRSIILGGDAQTDAWSRVLEEFPHLDKDTSTWARQIVVRKGRQPLLCDVLKVAHHCSKHGINLELAERMGDRYGTGPSHGPDFLVSSCAHGSHSTHGFPHAVAQEIMREVREPQARAGGSHIPDDDDDRGIHYTAQRIKETSQAAGSIAIVFNKDGDPPALYRLCDERDDDIDLSRARKVL